MSTKMKMHKDIRTQDFPDIAKRFGDDKEALILCINLIEASLNRIALNPLQEGKPCEYEPLKSQGFRKVKLFSVKPAPQGETPDLRIIYRYDAIDNSIEVLAIGFRLKERPRPAEDPYSRANARDLIFNP